MRRYWRWWVMLLVVVFVTLPVQSSVANPVIKEIIVKVIKAIDIAIQKLQNKTIWLKNAQKEIENILSKLKLKEIAEWTEKQKEQYRKYYEELAKVKDIISTYQRIKQVLAKQKDMVKEYSRVWALLKSDKHFTPQELAYMGSVYEGILNQSVKNADQIGLIIKAMTTKMADAKRLELIEHAAEGLESNYDDLKLFNQQNMLLSLQRAKSSHDVRAVKSLYGLP
jgi:hypothetical protein